MTPHAAPPRRPAPVSILLTFILPALAFLCAAALATAVGAATGYDHTKWLALHLFFVGGASGLVLGVAPFFVGAFLATNPAPQRLRRAQLASWNAGAILLPIGVLRGLDVVTSVGGSLLVVGLAAFVLSLRRQARRSLRRGIWPVGWYLTAAALLAIGIVVGLLVNHGQAGWHGGNLVAAHRSLNLAGWIGGAIVGTLHTFYPALTQTRLAFPRLETPTYVFWLAGVLSAAAGYAVDVEALTAIGYGSLVVAVSLLLCNMAVAVRRAPRIALPAQLVGVAQLMLLGGLLLALAATLRPASTLAARANDALLEVLVAGWMGLTILGALIHLLGTASHDPRGAHRQRRRSDALLVTLAVSGLAVLTVSELMGGTALDLPARVAVGFAYVGLTVHVVRLGASAIRTRSLRI